MCLIFSNRFRCVSFRVVARSRYTCRLSSILTDWSSPLCCLSLARPFSVTTHSNSRYGADDEDAAHEPPAEAHLPGAQPAERPPVTPLQQICANALTSSLTNSFLAAALILTGLTLSARPRPECEATFCAVTLSTAPLWPSRPSSSSFRASGDHKGASIKILMTFLRDCVTALPRGWLRVAEVFSCF